MVNIIERDGIITLDGQFFDLKVDNNRKIYIRKKGLNQFKSIDEELEPGLSSQEKQQYLYELYSLILKKLQDRQGIPKDRRAPLEPVNKNSKQSLPEPQVQSQPEAQPSNIKVK